MWREAIMDLLDQLEAENPEDQALAPREFSEWACVYIRYLQIFRKLEVAYDQMVHPQKLVDMKRALEACMGRMLEVRHWLVKLNTGSDFLNIDDILVDLKLTPDELEVPVPRCFRLDNQKVCLPFCLLSCPVQWTPVQWPPVQWPPACLQLGLSSASHRHCRFFSRWCESAPD